MFFVVNVNNASGKKQLKLIKEATIYYLNELFWDDNSKDLLEVTIEFDKEMDCCGHVCTEDDIEFSREFTIQINPQFCADNGESLYKTLAHECVHVYQYAIGNLYNTLDMDISDEDMIFSNKHIWMGELWKPKKWELVPLDSPWEIDAYGREIGMYYRWKRRKIYET